MGVQKELRTPMPEGHLGEGVTALVGRTHHEVMLSSSTHFGAPGE